MYAPAAPDPARNTLVEILKLLNEAEEKHEGKPPEQAMELGEIETKMTDFPPVKQGNIKVALAVGLLLRNRFVIADSASQYSWERQRDVAQRYRITPEGKKFLVDSIENSNRIS